MLNMIREARQKFNYRKKITDTDFQHSAELQLNVLNAFTKIE